MSCQKRKKTGILEGHRVIRCECNWNSSSSNEAFQTSDEGLQRQIWYEFQVDGSRRCTCQECNMCLVLCFRFPVDVPYKYWTSNVCKSELVRHSGGWGGAS